MSNWYEYDFYLSIGYANASREETIDIRDHGIDEEYWLKLTEDEKKKELDEILEDEMSNYLEVSLTKKE